VTVTFSHIHQFVYTMCLRTPSFSQLAISYVLAPANGLCR